MVLLTLKTPAVFGHFQHVRRGLGSFVLAYSDHATQSVIEVFPRMIDLPLENSIDGLPGRKIHGHIPPLKASFDDINDGTKDTTQISGRSSALGGLG